jgi:hypothetical protein
MVKVTLKAAQDEFKKDFPSDAIKHASYIKGLVEAAPEGDAELEVPHANEALVNVIVQFAEAHNADEEVTEEWIKQKPRELTEGDKALFTPIVGIQLVNLLKAANFIGFQMLLNAAATYVGQILVTKNEKEVQEYFGVFREFTKEEEDQVKAKYPVPFQ